MSPRILILSANSKVGAATARELLSSGVPVRAGVRDTSKAAELAGLGAEIAIADLDKPATLGPALAGIEKVLLTTAVDANVAAVHRRLYGPALEAGVKYAVRVSVIDADPKSPVTLGRVHGEGERELESSGLAWTHLRPHSFMQNLLGSVRTILDEGRIYSCMRDGRVPHVGSLGA